MRSPHPWPFLSTAASTARISSLPLAPLAARAHARCRRGGSSRQALVPASRRDARMRWRLFTSRRRRQRESASCIAWRRRPAARFTKGILRVGSRFHLPAAGARSSGLPGRATVRTRRRHRRQRAPSVGAGGAFRNETLRQVERSMFCASEGVTNPDSGIGWRPQRHSSREGELALTSSTALRIDAGVLGDLFVAVPRRWCGRCVPSGRRVIPCHGGDRMGAVTEPARDGLLDRRGKHAAPSLGRRRASEGLRLRRM